MLSTLRRANFLDPPVSKDVSLVVWFTVCETLMIIMPINFQNCNLIPTGI